MAKYTVTCCDCGTEFEVVMFGPMKQREWRLEHNEWMCDECAAKRRQEAHDAENAASAAENAKRDLPALKGTERQVAWAETLRARRLAELDAAGMRECDLASRIRREIEAQDSASWWIDHRNSLLHEVVNEIFEAVATLEEKLEKAEAEFKNIERFLECGDIRGKCARDAKKRVEALRAELERSRSGEKPEAEKAAEPQPAPAPKAVSVLEPQVVRHSVIGEVSEDGQNRQVAVRSEKDEDVRLALKAAGFVWQDGAWRYQGVLYRHAADYAVAALLRNGHRVKGREAAPESVATRFCTLVGSTHFGIIWWDRSRDWYAEAKHLPRARWDHGRMLVPVEYAGEVADFASANGFVLTPGARAAVDAQRQMTTVVAAPEAETAPEEPKLAPADGKIAEGLRDDD